MWGFLIIHHFTTFSKNIFKMIYIADVHFKGTKEGVPSYGF